MEQIGENSMVNMPADAWVERVKMVVILTHYVHYSLKSNHLDKLKHDPAKRFKQFQLCLEKKSEIALSSFNFALRLVQITQATI